MELEESSNQPIEEDHRKAVKPPLPVFLIAIANATLVTAAGLEKMLDQFYVGMLEFDRDDTQELDTPTGKRQFGIIYRAENFRLCFIVHEKVPEHTDMRMLGIIVKSIPVLEQKFRDAQIQYQTEHNANNGEIRLLVLDPARNWLRIEQVTNLM